MNIKEQLDRADELIEAGDFSAAMDSYHHIIQDNPDCDEAWLMLGSLYGESGDIDKATEYVEKAISINPEDSHSYLVLGQIKNSCGEYDAAENAFKEAAERDPNNTDALCMLASIYQQQGKAADAINYFEQAIGVDDSLVNAWAMLGPLHFQENNPEAAEVCFKKTLSLPDADAYSLLGYCGLLNSLDRSSEVLDLLANVPEHVKSNPEVLYQLSTAYLKEGDNAKALDYIESAITFEPHEKFVLSKVTVLQTMAKYEEAFELLKPFLEKAPPDATATIILSKFCMHVGLESECKLLLERVSDEHLSPYVRHAVDEAKKWLDDNAA